MEWAAQIIRCCLHFSFLKMNSNTKRFHGIAFRVKFDHVRAGEIPSKTLDIIENLSRLLHQNICMCMCVCVCECSSISSTPISKKTAIACWCSCLPVSENTFLSFVCVLLAAFVNERVYSCTYVTKCVVHLSVSKSTLAMDFIQVDWSISLFVCDALRNVVVVIIIFYYFILINMLSKILISFVDLVVVCCRHQLDIHTSPYVIRYIPFGWEKPSAHSSTMWWRWWWWSSSSQHHAMSNHAIHRMCCVVSIRKWWTIE